MTADDDQEFFKTLEEMGESRVRAMVKSNECGTRLRAVTRWLEIKDAERGGEKRELETRAVVAAEESAKQAEKAAAAGSESAKHAKRSADAAESSADSAKRTLLVAVVAAMIAAGALIAQCSMK